MYTTKAGIKDMRQFVSLFLSISKANLDTCPSVDNIGLSLSPGGALSSNKSTVVGIDGLVVLGCEQ